MENINKILNRPIPKIIIGILVCVLVPILIMLIAIRPIFGLLDLPEATLK